MDFNLTEEHLRIRETCRKFAEKSLKPNAAEYDRTQNFPWEHVKKLGEMGMMGVVYPEEYNGAGMDYISYAIVIEEISRGDAATGSIVSIHNSLCLSPIYYFGTEEQKKTYLSKLTTGKSVGSFAMTEPGAGSDASAMKTRAERKNGSWILNGTKHFITNAAVADVAVVVAATAKDKGSKGLSLFIVPKGTKGFSVGKTENKMGICASATSELIFNDCEIPAENILGSEGQGFKMAMHTLDGGRVGIAAQAVGIAQAAMDEAVSYSRERVQFDKSLSNFQAIQWMIADMATEIEASRLLVYQAASLMGTKERYKYSKYAAMAKLFASETSHRVCHKALQIFGGYGYMKEYPMERFYRDSRITEIYEGTSEVQRMVISSSVLNSRS